MIKKRPTVHVELSAAQAVAVFIACSNYTPPRGASWAQRSQSLAVQAVKQAMRKAGLRARRKA